MTEAMIWCLVLLINVPSRLSSGTQIDSRSVCQGDDVQLFRNVSFNNGRVVSIYTNGDSHTLIATGNSLSTFSILPEYKKKMFFDELGTFWIRKIQRSDEQKYELRTKIDTNIMKVYAQIFVMEAPTKHCRPKLLKIDSALIASLESNECGYPTASVKWADYPGIYYMDKSTVKLPSGKESGTYHACVESPTLKCVTDFKMSDYCSSFVVEAMWREMLSLASYRPARGNDAGKGLGPATPMQRWIKDDQRPLFDDSNVKQGRIQGTGGIFMPVMDRADNYD